MNLLTDVVTWLLMAISLGGLVLQVGILKTVHREMRLLASLSESSRIAAAMFFDSQVARAVMLASLCVAGATYLDAPIFPPQFGHALLIRTAFLVGATNLVRLTIADHIRRRQIARLMNL